MGLFDSFKMNGQDVTGGEKGTFSENPIEIYDISELVARIREAQNILDEKVHNFLAKANADSRLVGNFNINEEWRCWLEQDKEASHLLFDTKLTDFDEEAVDCFKENYAEELSVLLSENAAIDKLQQQVDEYRLFKTCLFNVFNNGNDIPLHLYLSQVFDRAKEYGMTIKRHSKEDLDLLVSFAPLAEISRGDSFYSYEFYVRFNQNHKKECHTYTVCMMDAFSADSMYSGPVDLPIQGAFAKFNKDTDAFFFSDRDSIFYRQSLKAHRKKEKDKFGIPSDYFEGTFIDRAKLVDFSEKSYQYGNSKIFIPKSQIAFAGEKVYLKPWLYAKLKRPIEALEASAPKKERPSLDEKVASAAAQASAAGPSGNKKGHKRESKGRN